MFTAASRASAAASRRYIYHRAALPSRPPFIDTSSTSLRNSSTRAFSTHSPHPTHGTGRTDHHAHPRHEKHSSHHTPIKPVISSGSSQPSKDAPKSNSGNSSGILSLLAVAAGVGAASYFAAPYFTNWEQNHFFVLPAALEFNTRLEHVASPTALLYWKDQSLLLQRLVLDSKAAGQAYDSGQRDVAFDLFLQYILKEDKTAIIDLHHTVQRIQQNEISLDMLRNQLTAAAQMLVNSPEHGLAAAPTQALRNAISNDAYLIDQYFISQSEQTRAYLDNVSRQLYEAATILAEVKNLDTVGSDYLFKMAYVPLINAHNSIRIAAGLDLSQISLLSQLVTEYSALASQIATSPDAIKQMPRYEQLFTKQGFGQLISLQSLRLNTQAAVNRVVQETNRLMPFFAVHSQYPHSIPLPVPSQADFPNNAHPQVSKLHYSFLPQPFPIKATMTHGELSAIPFHYSARGVSEPRLEIAPDNTLKIV